jgi:ATP-dependent helicase YprA (DUF1998 family)
MNIKIKGSKDNTTREPNIYKYVFQQNKPSSEKDAHFSTPAFVKVCDTNMMLSRRVAPSSLCKVLNRGHFFDSTTPDFSRFNLHESLLHSLQINNIHQPSYVQSLSLPLIQEGKHSIITAPTGSGKSLTYIIPVSIHFCLLLSHFLVFP